MSNNQKHDSSFRDPSGYVFWEEGVLKRCINPIYFRQYEALKSSGFFQKLIDHNLLISHEELSSSDQQIILKPESIPFFSYPYEWCFNQYKEAALLTLKIQKLALEYGFSLKDASAFNITFYKGKAVFIDTLSFDFYSENRPWRAYKQFLMHFFAPLVLAKYHGAKMLNLMQQFVDGIPLDLASSMLPLKTKLHPFLYSNIHLPAKFEKKHNEDYEGKTKSASLSKKNQLKIVESLYSHIKGLSLDEKSEWGNYYDKTNYSDKAFNQKAEIINQWIDTLTVNRLIDIGGNDGTFVRKINRKLELALVSDIDNAAVDFNYIQSKKNKENNILPLVIDVLNPSSSIGFNNKERDSFLKRIRDFAPDVTLALAIIHHISLSGNVPFDMSASFFAKFSKCLVIEFPKREDSWVQRLLNTKEDFKEYFGFYNQVNFENAYLQFFNIIEKQDIQDAHRVMYLLKRKDDY